MTEEQHALEQIDRELDAVLGGMAAPPTLAPAVMRRTVMRPARLPEVLDAVAWLAVVSAVLGLYFYFVPPVQVDSTMLLAAVGTALLLAYGFALRCLREA